MVSQAITDKDAKVRLAVVQNNNPINAAWDNVFEQALRDSSYEIVENALEKLCLNHPEKDSVYLAATKDLKGMGMSVRIKWLEIASVRHPEHLKELVSYTGHQFEFRTRINSMNAIQRLNYLNNDVALNLYSALLSSNSRLAGPAGKVIDYFAKQNNNKLQLQQAYRSKKWAAWQAPVIEKAIN